jgi:hypothetical protein
MGVLFQATNWEACYAYSLPMIQAGGCVSMRYPYQEILGIIDETARPPPYSPLAGKGACAFSCLKKDTHTWHSQ